MPLTNSNPIRVPLKQNTSIMKNARFKWSTSDVDGYNDCTPKTPIRFAGAYGDSTPKTPSRHAGAYGDGTPKTPSRHMNKLGFS
jgi:hypothetical protein